MPPIGDAQSVSTTWQFERQVVSTLPTHDVDEVDLGHVQHLFSPVWQPYLVQASAAPGLGAIHDWQFGAHVSMRLLRHFFSPALQRQLMHLPFWQVAEVGQVIPLSQRAQEGLHTSMVLPSQRVSPGEQRQLPQVPLLHRLSLLHDPVRTQP